MYGTRSAFYDSLCFFIAETVIGIYDCPAEPLTGHTTERSHLENCREGEFLFMRSEGTKLVRKLFRKHWDSPVDKIYRCAAASCFLVNHTSRTDIMSHISYVDSHLIIAVIKFSERDGIIEILGICRVNRKGEDISEILSSLEIFSCDFL